MLNTISLLCDRSLKLLRIDFYPGVVLEVVMQDSGSALNVADAVLGSILAPETVAGQAPSSLLGAIQDQKSHCHWMAFGLRHR